eukprot:XP_001611684.1 hypothetical protein [Babesia bovis T2Bo]
MTKTLENRIFSIYGILPHAELNDVYVVLAAMMFLTVLRLIFAGVNHKGKARWPSVFTVVIDKLQLAKKDKTYKMAESFWFFSESIEDVMNKTITWPYITMTPKLRLLTLVSIDVLLYTTKTLSYMQHAPEFLTAGFFVMYAMGHFFFRFVMMWKLVAYPFFGEMDTEEFYGGGLKYLWQLPGGIIGPCLLVVLTVSIPRLADILHQIMNTYWMNLIIGMMANFARGAKIG